MKEPQFGNNSNWDAASRGKPIFPSATNIRFVSFVVILFHMQIF